MTGKELKEKRQRIGLTQTQLAKRWEVPQSTISRWENEKHEIQHSKILMDALNYIETNKFLGIQDYENK